MAKKPAASPQTGLPKYSIPDEKRANVIGRRIAMARKECGLTLKQFAEQLAAYGVTAGHNAISKWETGGAVPNAYQLMAVSHLLGIENMEEYFTGCVPMALNREGRDKLRAYRADLIATNLYRPEPRTSFVISFVEMPVSSLAVSAGTGEFLEEGSFELVRFPASAVPEKADFGVRVNGDSMEPVYHDGQIVWVQQCEALNPGEVGVFLYDGEGYIKCYDEQTPEDALMEQFTDSDGVLRPQPVLRSYNGAYPPKPVSPELTFSVVGRVLN